MVQIHHFPLDNLRFLTYDCLINGSVAYWLKPTPYKCKKRVQFSPEPPWDGGGSGRRTGLKIRWEQSRESSSLSRPIEVIH